MVHLLKFWLLIKNVALNSPFLFITHYTSPAFLDPINLVCAQMDTRGRRRLPGVGNEES